MNKLTCFVFLGEIALSSLAGADFRFVDANLTTGANDGTSWADAFRGSGGLESALDVAEFGDQIYVATGTYLPTQNGSRAASLRLISGIRVYGGFLGGEQSPEDRPPIGTAPTILSGDLNGNDGPLGASLNDNSRHVVRMTNVGASSLLDRFVIQSGHADSNGGAASRGAGALLENSSATLRDCRFTDNFASTRGGAVYIQGGRPSFVSCVLQDNEALEAGGALAGVLWNGSVESCIFRGNRAELGSAAFIAFTEPSMPVTFLNCLIADNVATGSTEAGAAAITIPDEDSVVRLDLCTIAGNFSTESEWAGVAFPFENEFRAVDCIVFHNADGNGMQTAAAQLSPGGTCTFSIVQGGYPGAENTAADPQFLNSTAGDYSLAPGSPAIDASSGTGLALSALTTDLAGNPRKSDVASAPDVGVGPPPVADRGAYERNEPIGVLDPSCISLPNSTGMTGVLEATGSLDLAGNSLDLVASQLPPGQVILPILSASTASLPIGSGTLCLGTPLLRFTDDLLIANNSGRATFDPDLQVLPQGTVFQSGQTWWFQLWHRDLGGTSNFTASLGIPWN